MRWTVPTGRSPQVAERYFWLFEDSPAAKYTCDLEGKVLEVNAALCRSAWPGPEEIVGQTISSFSADPALPADELGPFLSGQARTYSGMRRYRGRRRRRCSGSG